MAYHNSLCYVCYHDPTLCQFIPTWDDSHCRCVLTMQVFVTIAILLCYRFGVLQLRPAMAGPPRRHHLQGGPARGNPPVGPACSPQGSCPASHCRAPAPGRHYLVGRLGSRRTEQGGAGADPVPPPQQRRDRARSCRGGLLQPKSRTDRHARGVRGCGRPGGRGVGIDQVGPPPHRLKVWAPTTRPRPS